METKQCSRCKKDKVLTDYDNDRRQCNECIDKRHEYYHNNKDKHKEWDGKHYETYQEDKKTYRTIQIECPVCKKYKKTDHEKTKRHIYNLNNPNNLKQTNKQQREQQQTGEKKTEQIRHQLTIEYFNDNFPSFPSE